ncbi:MAG: FIST C-terminal domain-containing protein [Thiotrichales bacterium]|nr:FIST C-terminal domain-containing protein [Thiotrichales bacterium]
MKLETFEYVDGEWSVKLKELTKLDSPQTLGLVFADNQIEEIESHLAYLQQAFPQTVFIGGSTAGEILGSEVKDESIAVSLIQFEKSRFQVVSAAVDDFVDAQSLGEFLGSKLKSFENPLAPLKGIFVLSDGINVNGTPLVKGITAGSPQTIITGGLMGDGSRFEQTYVLADKQWASKQVVAVGFYGKNLSLSHGSKGGWDVFGPERLVTHSVDNVVYEFDGAPALELYKTYLGELSSGLPGTALLFPLSMIGADGERLVRTIVQVDEEKNALIFAGDVPQGSRVQLMKANFDRLIDGAYSAAELVAWSELSPKYPTLSIAISCVGRRLILKGRIEEEVEATLDALPDNTQQIGFYSYGEISPLGNGVCSLHNQTMTLTTIREM